MTPFHVTPEMVRLRSNLDMLGIAWVDKSSTTPDCWICRTHFFINGNRWSVVHGYGTYGGYSFYNDHDAMKLELMTNAQNDGEPIGYLTANEILKLINDEVLKNG